MQRKKQVTISVNGVMVVEEVWLVDVVELCISGLSMLGQLGANVDTAIKQQNVGASASAATVGHTAKRLHASRRASVATVYAAAKQLHVSARASTVQGKNARASSTQRDSTGFADHLIQNVDLFAKREAAPIRVRPSFFFTG